MSIFGLLSKPLAWILSFIYDLIGSYGITLVILTLIVKGALYPLYKKQILSTAGMSEMQPKIQEIQRKYANDKAVMQEKMSELQKEEGYSPLSGCLPMIIQMLIIMSLFTLLRYPLTYLSSSKMTFAVHESFLWIDDLSQPDLWVLPILAGLATFFSFFLNQQNSAGGPGGSAVMMKAMSFVFPIMIVWLARTYPSGLAIYWFISQFVQIFYNLRFNKLRKALKENKPKKKKKK